MSDIKTTIGDCVICGLDTIERNEGALSVIERDFKRVYFIYNIPDDARRGGHAHKELTQFMIAVHGSFRVKIDDGTRQKTYLLNDPSVALFIGKGIWRDFFDFSNDAVVLVLASDVYNEDDYIRDYIDFVNYKTNECL